ncbi:MAG: molybdopterin molybdotransferase MoeA [Planctomycetia bacterium]|nr:molybdopterin molybdotransferase MoeA [Planctomycetia bacterium]
MITVEEALQHVSERARPLSARTTPIRDALGLALDEDVTSDIDSPPYDKSVVDGYAVMAADLARDGHAQLAILEEVVAGSVPQACVASGSTTRVMTGAPIPKGADAVVMIERTEPVAGAGLGSVVIRDASAKAGSNILRRGVSLRAGDVVLRRGTRLRAMEIGLLAEVGRAAVRVVPRPRVAILPTGNELVDASATPAAGQIRNSNGPMLAAAARQAGAEPIEIEIARDEMADLRRRIAEGLEADVLLLSGGVSAGVLDLVPRVLADLGATEVFHKVRLKPGKPLWFGVQAADDRAKLIFGLPGNPVSSFVCFELFVRPAIERLRGRDATSGRRAQARLTKEYRQRGDRTTYFPATLSTRPDGTHAVTPVGWQGSADLRGLSAANALAIFPPGEKTFAEGDVVDVLLLDEV